MSAKKSFKDNRNLGKVRPNPSSPDRISREKTLDQADIKSIDYGIKFRMERYSSFSKTRYFFTALAILTLLFVIWLLFF